ncbi:hypothetical protein VLK31_28070 [Variovorax sp. H27-G14]|uniref:hypothetical protein n=1 Tax=Variovorax sp. H27-G14 TaxID=3111914 RepID=UPI0038FD36B8
MPQDLCEKPMSLLSSMKYLSERGITVREMSPSRYSLHVEGKRHSILEEGLEGFSFRCWESPPGPGKSDFHIAFRALDDALLAAWYFYFGQPVVVGEWHVSMHQHPNWSLGKLAYCIANASHVTDRQFETTAELRRDNSAHGRLLSDDRYARALRSQFIACPSASASLHTLMLRRDLEEAYVVNDQQ